MLERLEERSDAGVLSYDNEDVFRGSFVLRDGRLCLVVSGKQHQLSTLLAQECPDASDVIRKAFSMAKDRNVRLGDALMELGAPVIDRIRACLRRYSALALIDLAKRHVTDEFDAYLDTEPLHWRDSWIPAKPDYSSALTFSLIEIYMEAAGLLDDAPEDLALRAFNQFARMSDFAVLLTEEHPEDMAGLPLSVYRGEFATLAALRKLAHSVHLVSHVPALVAAGYRPRSVMMGNRFNDHVFVFGEQRVALLATGDVGTKAQVTNWVLQNQERSERAE